MHNLTVHFEKYYLRIMLAISVIWLFSMENIIFYHQIDCRNQLANYNTNAKEKNI